MLFYEMKLIICTLLVAFAKRYVRCQLICAFYLSTNRQVLTSGTGQHHHHPYCRVHQHPDQHYLSYVCLPSKIRRSSISFAGLGHHVKISKAATSWNCGIQADGFKSEIVFYAYHGIRANANRRDAALRNLPYLGIAGVGIGSAVFHSTLKNYTQWCECCARLILIYAFLNSLEVDTS